MIKFARLEIFFIVGVLLLAAPALAYVMSSTNYRIERDSINVGGGLSDSVSYSEQSTLGEAGSGFSSSSSYSLSGGYQQMEQSSISLTVPGALTLSPAIDGSVGGSATASAAVNVSTGNVLGYTLQIKSNSSPALVSGSDHFSDYTVAAADPDYDWLVPSSASGFGFTPEGADIASRFKDNGVVCNQPLGTDSPGHCWDGLTTAYATIARSASGNLPLGADTEIRFKAEAGATAAQPAGSYSATAVFTAFAN